MSIDVAAALKGLQLMTATQLRDRYAEVFGEATRSFNKQHLVIARKVTGAHWNGYHFFGLKKPSKETASS